MVFNVLLYASMHICALRKSLPNVCCCIATMGAWVGSWSIVGSALLNIFNSLIVVVVSTRTSAHKLALAISYQLRILYIMNKVSLCCSLNFEGYYFVNVSGDSGLSLLFLLISSLCLNLP